MHASVSIPQDSVSVFRYGHWNSQLPALVTQYRESAPIPHILLKDFVDWDTANRAIHEFPPPSTLAWTHYQHQNENKLGLAKRDLFPPTLGELVDELNSRSFTDWLSELTGIADLLPDPGLEGAGLHQSVRGGFLNVHTDFSHHHYQKNWRRRINLILYLNDGWREEWGGAIELWDKDMRSCVAKYPPLFNHALIFNTDTKSFHGFPEPLTCPQNVYRKSLALYYYTLEKDSSVAVRSTDYRSRPGDGFRKSALIWLDKQAVNLYSKAKARLGFSDRFASRVLALLFRKK
jgi:Rps23 Pro-64 3,4-dihydroxylase Tpa1-like proline 4-hydroxylase